VKHDGTVAMSYLYNGKGERVHKAGSGSAISTLYDEDGKWIGDYDANGQPIQQVVWLDKLPVGLLVGAGASQKLYYIEADALGTPRVVIDPDRNVAVWHWDLAGEAFGDSAPDEDPDADNIAFVFDMRFPGQRYDSATGMNYNYFRDYDPGTGRYVQSDPVGLDGGISTYGYVFENPMLFADTLGLDVDINLLPPNSKAYQYARLYKNDPNECTIIGHGKPMSLAGRSSDQILKIIQSTPSCKGKPIRLLGCNTGVRPKSRWSFAQLLANKTGMTVYAPGNWGWLPPSGDFFIAPTTHNLPWTTEESVAMADLPNKSKMQPFLRFDPKVK
jgi:RHS repeat-associated protein